MICYVQKWESRSWKNYQPEQDAAKLSRSWKVNWSHMLNSIAIHGTYEFTKDGERYRFVRVKNKTVS
jgi:hypothetical protein